MGKEKLKLFLGPCVLESRDLAFKVADTLKTSLHGLEDKIDWTFKGSYDKANRTSADSYRGPGIEKGLKILEEVKKEFQVTTVTDFHYPQDAKAVAEVVDYLQVPAFLCRQTDMILEGSKAAKEFGRYLKVKKGQFLAPGDTKNIVEKATTYLDRDKILLTERGTSFGYNQLIVDMASFKIMKEFGVRTVHDATHCVQRPGALGKATGGNRDQVEVLAKAAMAAGADGVFIETHPEPRKALSDASTCLPLENIPSLVERLLKIYEVV